MGHARRATAALALLLTAAARAQDPFEIQVYDGTANRPGAAGLEVHLNYVASGVPFSGGPLELQPAATVIRRLGDAISVGLESYSGLGALASPSPLKEQEHYLFEVVNLTAFAGWELHAGIGQGLTRASNPLVV